MVHLCRMTDVEILNRLRSGEWVASLDTGKVYSTRKKGFLKPVVNADGYELTSRLPISHIIWVAANGPVPYGMEIDHINGDKKDNRLCNLRMVTSSENVTFASASLTYAQAEEIRRRYAAGGVSQTQLAREYGVTRTVTSRVLRNQTYHKPVSTEGVTDEMRKKIVEVYQNGGKIDTIRKTLKVQQAVIRQVLEEELGRDAAWRKQQDAAGQNTREAVE